MRYLLVIAVMVLGATQVARADMPAWCGGKASDANSYELRALKNSPDDASLVQAVFKLMCSNDAELVSHRGEVEQVRTAWSKKLGMDDADWADVGEFIEGHGEPTKPEYSTKDIKQLTPIDQYAAIKHGFGDGFHGADMLYATDVLDQHLTETGRMAFIDWCLNNDDVARADGDMPKWAVCWPDIEKFDAGKVLAEIKSDKAHNGHERMMLRMHTIGMAAAIKDVADRRAKFVKADDTWQKVAATANKAREEWAKSVGTNTKLLDLALAMDGAAFFHSNKLLEGCEPKTEEALAAAVATVPSKSFTGMHDDREMAKKGFAESAGPLLVNTPVINVAATAYAECHPKTQTADYLDAYLQYVPGARGPRDAALAAVMGETFKFDDTNAKPLDFPRFGGRPASRSGGSIMSFGGVVKSVKKDKDSLLVAVEATSLMQEDCVKEHRSNHISRIRDDGSLEYEMICEQTKMVKHNTTWPDFKVTETPAVDKVLKPGVVLSCIRNNGPCDVVAIWPTKTAKTPSWVLGATVK